MNVTEVDDVQDRTQQLPPKVESKLAIARYKMTGECPEIIEFDRMHRHLKSLQRRPKSKERSNHEALLTERRGVTDITRPCV